MTTDTIVLPEIVSKPTDERGTPQFLFEALDLEFHFSWDLAALASNAKVPGGCYFGPDHEREEWRDALAVDWHKVLPAGSAGFWNPPFSGNQIRKFCEKAEREAEHGITSVGLIPGDVSTEYYHRFVMTGERRVLKMRLAFEGVALDAKGRKQPAKFGSVIRIWRPTHRYWSFA